MFVYSVKRVVPKVGRPAARPRCYSQLAGRITTPRVPARLSDSANQSFRFRQAARVMTQRFHLDNQELHDRF